MFVGKTVKSCSDSPRRPRNTYKLKSSREIGWPAAPNSSNNALDFCINWVTDSSPCQRSWKEAWSCIIRELDEEAIACSSVRQIELEVWQSTTRWRTSMDSEDSKAWEWVGPTVSNKEKNVLPEENYHQQQIHVEGDKNLSHPQTRKLLSLLDMASSAFANKGNWCLLIWERWLGKYGKGKQW